MQGNMNYINARVYPDSVTEYLELAPGSAVEQPYYNDNVYANNNLTGIDAFWQVVVGGYNPTQTLQVGDPASTAEGYWIPSQLLDAVYIPPIARITYVPDKVTTEVFVWAPDEDTWETYFDMVDNPENYGIEEVNESNTNFYPGDSQDDVTANGQWITIMGDFRLATTDITISGWDGYTGNNFYCPNGGDYDLSEEEDDGPVWTQLKEYFSISPTFAENGSNPMGGITQNDKIRIFGACPGWIDALSDAVVSVATGQADSGVEFVSETFLNWNNSFSDYLYGSVVNQAGNSVASLFPGISGSGNIHALDPINPAAFSANIFNIEAIVGSFTPDLSPLTPETIPIQESDVIQNWPSKISRIILHNTVGVDDDGIGLENNKVNAYIIFKEEFIGQQVLSDLIVNIDFDGEAKFYNPSWSPLGLSVPD